MLEKAKEGSVAAAKLVFGYVFGRPDKALSFHLNTAPVESGITEEGIAGAIAQALAENKPGLDPETEALMRELFLPTEAKESPRRANGVNGGRRRK